MIIMGSCARASLAMLTLATVTGCTGGSTGPVKANAPGAASRYQGIELPTHRPIPHITLTDTRGYPYDPAAHDDRPVTVLFTGYTHCPDVCPTTMADLATVLRQRPALRAKVRVLFISTDPRRDSPSHIRAWLDRFDATFVGLRGTKAQVSALSGQLSLPLPEDNGTTHSSELLAFTRGHGTQLAWLSDVTPSVLEHDLSSLTATL